MKFIESEYDDFSLFVDAEGTKVEGKAFVFDKNEDQWYEGKVIAVTNEDPEDMSGDYAGEFIFQHKAFSVSIDVAKQIDNPNLETVVYC